LPLNVGWARMREGAFALVWATSLLCVMVPTGSSPRRALIADYLKSVSKEAFLNDRLRQDAVIRRIQVVETEKAAKEVQANPREPQRKLAENGGRVITSVITHSP
jgi:hypothetical protein